MGAEFASMARKVRVQYAGAIYHLMSRGDQRAAVFKDGQDRQVFLDTLAQACEKTGWQVHAWCLMDNHFHLVIETPQPNLVAGMKWLLGTYTGRFNRRHQLCGHLFSGRYKALVVEGSGNGYLRTVCDYVHLNPVRANLLRASEGLETYPWSSFNEYLMSSRRRPVWLRVDRLMGEMGIAVDSVTGRRQFAEQMEQRRAQELGEEWRRIRRGWCLGRGTFRLELLDRMCGQIQEHHYGAERREVEEERGARLIAAGLALAQWKPSELAKHSKSHPIKVALALRLRRETTLTLKWIAARLHMGSWEYLNRLLYRARKEKDHKVRN